MVIKTFTTGRDFPFSLLLSHEHRRQSQHLIRRFLVLLYTSQSMTTLPVATAVSGLTKTCLQTAVSLDSLRSKFPSADATISALCSECTQISASLTDVQMFVLTNDFDKRPELNDPFDTVLTACMVGYACLELRLKKLVSAPTANTSNSRTPWRVKAAAGWDEEAMRKYLGNLKGGKEALLVLVQLLPWVQCLPSSASDITC